MLSINSRRTSLLSTQQLLNFLDTTKSHWLLSECTNPEYGIQHPGLHALSSHEIVPKCVGLVTSWVTECSGIRTVTCLIKEEVGK